MTWKEQLVVRILLMVARMMADERWEAEIRALSNHITLARTLEQEMTDQPVT